MTPEPAFASSPDGLPRRALVSAAAWTVPAIVLTASSPAAAASPAVGVVLLEGPDVIAYVGSTYTVTVLSPAGFPLPGATVTITAPADTTFGGAPTATGMTDAEGRFSARLSATDNEMSGQRELIAVSGGVTATKTVMIPTPSVGFSFPLGTTYTTPFVIQFRALLLPGETEPGYFQGRVRASLAPSADYWLRSDGRTSSLSSPSWSTMNVDEWYTGGKGPDGSVFDTRVAWGQLDGDVGRVDQPLDAPVGLGTPHNIVYLDLRRLDMSDSHPQLRIQSRWFQVQGRTETVVGAGNWGNVGVF